MACCTLETWVCIDIRIYVIFQRIDFPTSIEECFMNINLLKSSFTNEDNKKSHERVCGNAPCGQIQCINSNCFQI